MARIETERCYVYGGVVDLRKGADSLRALIGEVRIDHNLAEQSIRPCKLGAKNWLFIGSPDTGKTSATIYTILESCRLRGIEPMSYLTDVLNRLPSMTNLPADALTPKSWSKG